MDNFIKKFKTNKTKTSTYKEQTQLSCNYCYEVVPGTPKYKADRLELFSADSIVSDREGQSGGIPDWLSMMCTLW